MSRRVFATLIVLACLLTLVVLYLAYSLWQRQMLASDSRNLAVSVTQTVLSTGSASALVEHAHEELLSRFPVQSLTSYIGSVPLTLGPLQEINEISGSVDAPLLPAAGRPATASYQLSLSFSRSLATTFVEMRRENGTWLFTRFRVDAPLLYN